MERGGEGRQGKERKGKGEKEWEWEGKGKENGGTDRNGIGLGLREALIRPWLQSVHFIFVKTRSERRNWTVEV